MEKKEELILRLAQMLQNNGTKSSVSKLPEKKQVEKAKENNITPEDDLFVYLNNRLECTCIDTSKAKGYLFIPYSKNQWKVFVVDCNNEPYAQLEDYCDVININKSPATVSFFIIK